MARVIEISQTIEEALEAVRLTITSHMFYIGHWQHLRTIRGIFPPVVAFFHWWWHFSRQFSKQTFATAIFLRNCELSSRMAWQIVRGRFYIGNYSPDGDSIRFKADGAWPTQPQLNHRSHAQLRLSGIDAPETHFGNLSQNMGLTARDALLNALGFTGVTYTASGQARIAAVRDGVQGSIATKQNDPYGRPIALVFSAAAAPDTADQNWMRASANYHLLLEGHCYPLFYEQDVMEQFQGAQIAEQTFRGVWGVDTTKNGVDASDPNANGSVCMPKLFRRLSSFNIYDGAFDFLARLASDTCTVNGAATHFGALMNAQDDGTGTYMEWCHLTVSQWDIRWN